MGIEQFCILAILPVAWIIDRILGDPSSFPHPVVGFGKVIAYGEKKWNKGKRLQLKGACFSVMLILASFFLMYFILDGLSKIHPLLNFLFSVMIVFFCLAGKCLTEEVKQVFFQVDESVEKGRIRLARIVGRDTSGLSALQIRTAALETLSENLSDGVIAPMFWYLLLGVPGMFAYKMVNTLDSMIGYRNERYGQFGCWAARIDDMANYVPARLTAGMMVLVSGKWRVFAFVKKYGKKHASPNSGYPEAALAGILNCRFGGPNYYFGEIVNKPYIGDNPKHLKTNDMEKAVSINVKVEAAMIVLVSGIIIMYI